MAAFQLSRVLLYYRLAGVLAFELTDPRLLPAVFPNAFEPFFIYFELVRHRGNPMRLTRIEKIVLVTMVSVIFRQILPGLKANGTRTALFIAVTIVVTDFGLRWVLRWFGIPAQAWVDLLVAALFNYFFVLLFQFIIPIIRLGYSLGSAVTFASLIALFVALYDHYRPSTTCVGSTRSPHQTVAPSIIGAQRPVPNSPDTRPREAILHLAFLTV